MGRIVDKRDSGKLLKVVKSSLSIKLCRKWWNVKGKELDHVIDKLGR